MVGRVARFSLWAIHPEGGPNGTEPWKVLDDPRAILSPAVMPDGRIAFASGRPAGPRGAGGTFAIYSVRPDGSDRRLESDDVNGYMAPFFASGAMVVHGPGPIPKDVPQTGAAALLGPGPLLAPGAPWRRTVEDRELRVYPLRELFVAAHPAGDSVLRTPAPGPRLVISRLDGSGAREVTNLNNPGFPAVGVTASPDGDWILYMQGAMFGDPEQEADLWRVRSDGSGAENLTPESPGNDGFASYSPDGSWIAFRSGRDGNYDIYRMDTDGAGVVNLTNHPARDVFPAVSPRGNQIAFVSDRDSAEPRLYEIYLMELRADGSPAAVRRITHNTVQEGHPQFSPDGEWIVFTSEMGGLSDEEPLVQSFLFSPQMYGEIYAYQITNGLTVRLTHNKWEDGFPTWVRAGVAGSP
jgi:Tol biopolymer transport system component